ncbi:hypothetical protein OZX74_01255 [Bifidobacterium sp. ESL0798]|uniref:hypothetical protein n=1 Tax=Bifidobacterium sp. ESL0798 TaxID=2983235 RepID=UPI0023F90164|nr:hypothetical protein [Bifidobacterium sp. ESL0798]WEV74222.1 hypothetical protein OZX74_01255 [Bifidobacterium sp. ESL0798]
MSKKHGKKIVSRKKFKVIDNLDTEEKRLQDRVLLMQMAMDEYDEYLGGTLERSVSWYLMCSWYGLSTMQSAILIARLATLLDASQTGGKWKPFVHARQGKHGLEIYARKNKSKREKGPAFDVAHIRMVMRSVMTKEKLEAITDDQVMRFARTLQAIAAREEEREAKNDRRFDASDSPGAVAFEDAKEYADPDALDDVDDEAGEAGIGIDVFADEEADFEASDDEEDAGVLAETGPLNESAATEGLSENAADTDSNVGARGKEGEASSDSSNDVKNNDVHGKHAQGNNSLSDIPELKRLDLGKGDKNK